VNASDPDGTVPVLSSSTLPLGASFIDAGNGNRIIFLDPGFLQSGTYNISYFATDGILRDTEAIVITVIDAGNQPPVLANIGARSTTEGITLTINVSSTDPEGGTDPHNRHASAGRASPITATAPTLSVGSRPSIGQGFTQSHSDQPMILLQSIQKS